MEEDEGRNDERGLGAAKGGENLARECWAGNGEKTVSWNYSSANHSHATSGLSILHLPFGCCSVPLALSEAISPQPVGLPGPSNRCCWSTGKAVLCKQLTMNN